jgi:hypothetical protein
MRFFKVFYTVVSYLFLIVQAGFICIWLYNKIRYDRTLFFGGDAQPEEVSANHFTVLKALLYATLLLLLVWSILTPMAIRANKRNTGDQRIHLGTGIAAFLIAITLLIIDPFGMATWLTR